MSEEKRRLEMLTRDANIVELACGDEEETAWDQPCRFGHRVGGHAVYCHNNDWADAPRKCRNTWYTGGRERDEDCPGYAKNEAPSVDPKENVGSGEGN